MEIQEIIAQVNTVFIYILDNENIIINSNSNSSNVEDWDSLTHIQLVVAIEKHFKIRFTSSEIQTFKNVGEMCEAIKLKLK